MAEPAPARPLVPAVRALLAAFAVLTLVATTQLFVFGRDTASGFAWTVRPPLSAAFLGAGYGAGCVLVVLSLRRGTWGAARVGFLTVWLFATAVLLVTLLHLDRFHLGAAGFVPRAAAWGWLAVYVAVPVAMAVALHAQLRAPGEDPRAGPRLGRGLHVALGAQAVLFLLVGVALFAVPAARDRWPWQLTPLTARAIACWLLALGLAAVLVVADDDLQRLRPAAATYAVLGVLQLFALLRFRADVDWGRAAAWAYLAAVCAVLSSGAAGLARSRRRTRRRAALGVG
ncbi:hypothetical protein [Kineococcus glutinatus]|uniref:Uncharacterized protein n=1 Tax=Kineococcus glutinatus TaxID=1070872 RepID=A0ABP8VPW0_9ACTN